MKELYEEFNMNEVLVAYGLSEAEKQRFETLKRAIAKEEGRNEEMIQVLLNQLKMILKEVSEELIQVVKRSSNEKLNELSMKILSITCEKDVYLILYHEN